MNKVKALTILDSLAKFHELKRGKYQILMDFLPFYIIMIAVAPMRAGPDQRSEQITQARLGEIVQFIEEDDGWYKVKLETDGYVGYISPGMVIGFSEKEAAKWRKSDKFIFGDRTAEILDAPFKSASLIRTAHMGAKLPLESRKGSWVELNLPDGINGWTHSRQFQLQSAGTREGIAKTAQLFLGAPYLWGGRSTAGFDCSGFVQTVFELNGIDLPRDTYQQITMGEKIGEDYNKAEKGDLVFFDNGKGDVSHIGIYLGEGRFIHSSGIVRINGLDSKDPNHSKGLRERFMHVRSVGDMLL